MVILVLVHFAIIEILSVGIAIVWAAVQVVDSRESQDPRILLMVA